MAEESKRPLFLDVSLEPIPMIEAFKKGVDRTLLVENLRRTVRERTERLVGAQRMAVEMMRAGERMRRKDTTAS